jgi:hypothetical protein
MLRQSAVAALLSAFAASAATQAPDLSIKDIVIGLGQARVPAGVVMSLRDFVNAEQQSATPRRLTAVPGGAASAADASLNLFTRGHPEFALDRSAQRVRLLRKDTPAEVMRRLTRVGQTEDRPDISASAAVVQVVGTLIRQQPTAGVLGSGPTPGEGCPLNAPVKIAPQSTTALDALDGIVAQVPGLSWFVLYEEGRAREKLDVGLWCPDGMYFRVELTL